MCVLWCPRPPAAAGTRGTGHEAAPPAGHTRTHRAEPSQPRPRKTCAHARDNPRRPSPEQARWGWAGAPGCFLPGVGTQTGGCAPTLAGGSLEEAPSRQRVHGPGCLGRHRRDPKGPARPPARCEELLSSTCFFKIQEPKSPTFPSKPPGGPNGHSHPAGLPAPRLGPQRLGAAWVGPRLARLKLGTHISAQKLRTNSQTETAFPTAAGLQRGEGPQPRAAQQQACSCHFFKVYF